MSIQIKRYAKADEDALFDLIRSEGEEWGDYARDKNAVEKFKAALNNSIVYAAYSGDTLCGFIRVKDDDGFGVIIYDLLVHKNFRGNSYGRELMRRVCSDFKDATVFVLSDEDGYYKKLGCKKVGTIFDVREQ